MPTHAKPTVVGFVNEIVQDFLLLMFFYAEVSLGLGLWPTAKSATATGNCYTESLELGLLDMVGGCTTAELFTSSTHTTLCEKYYLA